MVKHVAHWDASVEDQAMIETPSDIRETQGTGRRALRGGLVFLFGEPLALVCVGVCIWLIAQAVGGIRTLNQSGYEWQTADIVSLGSYLAVLSVLMLLALAHATATLLASMRARS